jgi:hypothetical protein
MEYGSKPPSEYEKFKKLLEQNYGGEIIGTGDETTLITPEMKAQAKKDSEFIGPEKGIPKKIESTRSITTLTKEELAEIEKELEIESYDKKYNEINNEIKNFKKEKIGIGGVEKEEDMGKDDLDTLESMRKRRDKYEEMSYDLDMGEVESFNKKIETKGLTKEMELAPIKPTLSQIPIPEEEEKTTLGEKLKLGVGKIKDKFKKEEKIEPEAATTQGEQPKYVVKDAEGNILSESIDKETASKKAGIAGLGIEPELVETPVTETPAVGVEQVASEEKQPLGKRLKEGFGNIVDKGKEKFQDVKEQLKETKEDKGPIGKRLTEGVGKIFEKGKEVFKPNEEQTKVEPVKQDMFPLSKGFDGPFYEMKDGKLQMRDPYEMLDEKEKKDKESAKIEPEQTKVEPTEITPESGYLKMLEENDEKAVPFLTSKSGRPVNLDKVENEKIELKGIEGFGKKEKPSPFGLDMKMFEQKLPEPPKASLEKTKTDKIDVKAIEDSAPNEEDTRSALEKVSLTAAEDEGFEGGIIEPVEPVTITPEVDKEKEETKARSFAYLEELRLREQTPSVPETPAKGIEKLAQLGQKFEGRIGGIKEKLFGKKEEESSLSEYEPEISTEEPYMSESIKEAGTEDYGTLAEEAESEYTPTTVGAIEEVIPSIPEPTVYPFGQLQEVMGQGAGGGQPGAKGESTENINMNVKLEIVGNGEFAKLIDPRQFQQKIESIMMTSIGKTQVAQRFNSATNTKTASMGQLE